jgi:GNAT superfamily N-acetyltransferase
MNEQNTQQKIKIKHLTPQASKDLRKYSFFAGVEVLNQGLLHNFFQSLKLLPKATRLVAFDIEKKKAVGFICLEENTKSLYSIKYVFVDPEYRNRGIASRLLGNACTIAKTKGATKVNLNVYVTSTNAIALYKKLGFRDIGYTTLQQKCTSDFSRLVTIKRFIFIQENLAYRKIEKENQLFEIQPNLKNRKKIFDIYKLCMSQPWIDFFEIDSDNIIDGSRHVWQPLFFRHILINNPGNSFALIFKSPLSNKVIVELYSTHIDIVPSILEDLLKILSKRGITFTQIWLFHSSKDLSNCFEKKGFKTFPFVGMGRNL